MEEKIANKKENKSSRWSLPDPYSSQVNKPNMLNKAYNMIIRQISKDNLIKTFSDQNY